MIVFIDESGIHKQDGSSTAALVYVEVEHIEKLDKAILNIEKTLGIEPFHWSKQIWKIRKIFLEGLLTEEFQVKIFVFNNPFSDQKMESALQYLLTDKYIRSIVIDGDKTRKYVLYLKKILRQVGIGVKKVRMGNDIAFPCLRLADLFAGLTRAYINNPENKEAEKLYNLAKIKITTLSGGQVPPSLF